MVFVQGQNVASVVEYLDVVLVPHIGGNTLVHVQPDGGALVHRTSVLKVSTYCLLVMCNGSEGTLSLIVMVSETTFTTCTMLAESVLDVDVPIGSTATL